MLWIWVANALLMGFVAGLLFSDHMKQGTLQLVVESVFSNEPGEPRVRAWGFQIKTGAIA